MLFLIHLPTGRVMLSIIILICTLTYNTYGQSSNSLYSSVAKSDVTFILFTLTSAKQDITNNDLINLKDAGPLKFIVHGWGETMNNPYYKNLSDAYIQRGNYSIIYVDWSKLGTTWYSRAITNTLEAGRIIAEFILHLYEISKIDLDNIHILGHSLGAHVAGVAGETIHKRTGNKIGRITGLDPAKPLYEGFIVTATKKLSKGDAKMVDIIHTDAGNFGCENNMGTVDFFPNGGVAVQPGCLKPITTHDIVDAIKNFIVVPFPHIFCSHRKSITYYIKSVYGNHMIAYKCKSWKNYVSNRCHDKLGIQFGEDTPMDASGTYFIPIE